MFERLGFDSVPRETALVVGLVSGSHVVNHLYLVLFPPILATLAADFDVGLGALGVAMGVQAFVNTALQLPYGYLSDNYDRVVTLALCLGVGAFGAGILAIAPTFEVLLVGQAVLGAGIAGHHPAHFPLLSDASSAEFRGKAYSAHGFAGNLGFAAPPVVILGVTSLPGATWRHAFGLIAVVGAVYGAIACYVLARHVSDEVTRPNTGDVDADDARTEATSRLARVREEIRALGASRPILGLGVIALLASTAFWGVSSYLVVFLEDGYGVASGVASLSLTAMFVSGAALIIAGGVLADRFRPGGILAGAYLLVGVAVFALASMAAPPLVAVGIGVLAGSLGSLGLPARDKLADLLSARSDIGRNFAVVTIGIMIGNTVAPPLFGALIESSGYRGTFTLVGAFAVLAAIATVAIVARYRDGIRAGSEAAAAGE
ncbi:Predicted arabinose efflux permease, MFS family [Halorubrum aquaticum]|uniref:Predicted arabinose efflux permease, MFS family n=1 Tax=Halorubrum aquaticum TaxID=387340 RepID=A0A1I3AB25_9EURY|nr:MFS transporter [Halorubrum aquaticum]SFH47284.1 Predicted arabinose efflux permease, MFS family [Halorubrum aquaticum]